MEKREFDKLVGMDTAPECYERIEYVYMNDNEFSTKQQIADFYKKYDMNGIEKKYQKLLEAAKGTSLEVFANEVTACSSQWVIKMRHYMAANIKEWYNNEFVVQLFDEWQKNKIKHESDLIQETKQIMDGREPSKLSEFSGKDLSHYNTVIYELLIRGRVPEDKE